MNRSSLTRALLAISLLSNVALGVALFWSWGPRSVEAVAENAPPGDPDTRAGDDLENSGTSDRESIAGSESGSGSGRVSDQPRARGADGGARRMTTVSVPTGPDYSPLLNSLAEARQECEIDDDAEVVLQARVPPDGRLTDISVVRGPGGATAAACIVREVTGVQLHERDDDLFVTTIHSANSTSTSSSQTPPMTEQLAEFPGVDRGDVIRSCESRGDFECVVRLLGDEIELDRREQSSLLTALWNTGDWDEMLARLGQVPEAEAYRYARFQAALWRREHDLPLGPAPSSMTVLMNF